MMADLYLARDIVIDANGFRCTVIGGGVRFGDTGERADLVLSRDMRIDAAGHRVTVVNDAHVVVMSDNTHLVVGESLR